VIFLDEKGKLHKFKKNEIIHTHKGYFKFNEEEKIFETNKGFKFFKTEDFIDKIKLIKRGPQTSHFKDLGVLFAKILPQRDWIMLEAGTGSGMVSLFFSNYVKEIYTFEKRKEFYEIAKKNFENLNINNIKIFNKDLKEVKELNVTFDFVFLDLGEPWEFLDLIYEKLRFLGFLAVYLVSPRQLDLFINKIDKNKFIIVDIFEVLERNWEVKEDKEKRYKFTKPRTTGLMFTSFIALLRKI
jgi:tRNA (adenine57-N1/adenine58-N1)-methyltransferase